MPTSEEVAAEKKLLAKLDAEAELHDKPSRIVNDGSLDIGQGMAFRNNARLREHNELDEEGRLYVRDWHPELLMSVDSPTLFLIGKRRTGKSFFVRWLLFHLAERFPFGLIFTETKFNGFWQKHFPSAFIHDVYKPELVQAIMDRQMALTALALEGRLPRDLNIEIFILFDDVMGISGETIKQDIVLKQLLTQGRHFKITVLFNMQDIYGLPPVDRNNIDFVFLFKQHQKRNMDAIYENWLTFLETPSMAARTICQLTRSDLDEVEYDVRGRPVILSKAAMIIDTANDYSQPIDQIYSTSAVDPGPFLLGSEELWLTSKRKVGKPAADIKISQLHMEEIAFGKVAQLPNRKYTPF